MAGELPRRSLLLGSAAASVAGGAGCSRSDAGAGSAASASERGEAVGAAPVRA
jgi:hypothetical protein